MTVAHFAISGAKTALYLQGVLSYAGDLTLAGHGFNALQLRLQGGERSRISLLLIGTRRPVIADLRLDRRACARWLGRDLKHGLVEERLVPQLQLPE